MLSLSGLLFQNTNGNSIPRHDSWQTEFTGRLDRRLSFVFVSLFALVVLVGGTSLYLLSSHLLKSDVIARQSEQVHIVEQIDRHLQSFTSEIQLAQLQSRAVPESFIPTSMKDFETLLTLYKQAGGAERNIQEMRQMITDAERVATRFVNRIQNRAKGSPNGFDNHDLEVMEAIQQRIQLFTDHISVEHEKLEDELVSETRRKMRITLGFNVALVMIGTVFLLTAKRYFNHAIAQPLRQLAERSSDIAKGKFPENMPITSRDEIGLLSYSFNRMAEQLKEHEGKLKGLAILEERERLACELHDSLAQDLAYLRLKLIEAERSFGGEASSETKTLLSELFKIVDEAYQNLRESIFGLRALGLKTRVGLVAALGDYLKDFSEIRKIPVELKVDHPDTINFSSQVEIQLIRIIHEALTNIAKHAEGTKGKITIEDGGEIARITIEDDGRGFSTDRTAEKNLRFGLETMKDRAKSVGGKLSINSAPGQGTRVIIELPLAKQRYDESHPIAAS
jgi:nitrate/nitrite-specific signal transduction histidine kinase